MPRFLIAILVALVGVLAVRPARADASAAHAVPVAVLGLDSEDAEENADALTFALRSRVRASQGWSLVETTQSIGMLTAAFKCPAHPGPECEQRIAEQIKVDRFLWGYVTRAPVKGQVTATVTLYNKGKPETAVKQTYSDNLKEQNDDTLRKLATQILDQLGRNVIGGIAVRAPKPLGEIVLDGEKRIPYRSAPTRFDVAPGEHSVEFSAPGLPVSKRTVLVAAGRDTQVEIEPAPAIDLGPQAPEKPFPTRKVLGGVALGAGVILAAVAVQQSIAHFDFKSRGEDLASSRITAGEEPCAPNGDIEFCSLDQKARTSSAVAWITGGAAVLGIGAGIYLLFVAPDAEERATAKRKSPLAPTLGKDGGGLVWSGAF